MSNGSIGGPSVFTNFNPFWGAVRGVSYGLSGPSDWGSGFFPQYRTIRQALGLIPQSTIQTRTDVLWESGGAVGASAGGTGELDAEAPDVSGVLSGPVVGRLPEILSTVISGGRNGSSRSPRTINPEAEVAIDWGGIISGLGSQYIQAQYAPQPQFVSSFVDAGPVAPVPQGNIGGPGGITWADGGGGGGVTSNELCGAGPCSSPRYLTYDCRTGTFSKKRRRRRGRLLTASDQHDLGVIVAMFGKGAAGQIALAAAVKR